MSNNTIVTLAIIASYTAIIIALLRLRGGGRGARWVLPRVEPKDYQNDDMFRY